jgi:hypothetical protein
VAFLFLSSQIARKLQRPPLDFPPLSNDSSAKESPAAPPVVKPALTHPSAPASSINEDAANALSENMRKLEVGVGVGVGGQMCENDQRKTFILRIESRR